MQDDLKFIPKILLCGDEAEFFSRVGNRPFKIIGRAYISGEVHGQKFNFAQDNKIVFNDKLQDLPALINFLQSGAVDYFLFTNLRDFALFRNNAYKRGFLSSKVVTLDQFKAAPKEFFCDMNADLRLLPHLKDDAIKTLLDADGYFSQGRIFTKLENDFTEIDAVTDKPPLPIRENIYTHVYKNLAEVGFKHYDAVLIIERKPADFENMLRLLENFSDKVITYARTGSKLERYIFDNANKFAEVRGLHVGAGNWYLLTKRTPPADFGIYVVTHKAVELNNLPEGYKIIHAGKILGKDLGYLGDDTGDNISELNLYLNEITALYWLWKNTNHTTIGLCHYRRFFTEAADDNFAFEKILTEDAALKILERYDMIVTKIYYGGLIQREWIVNDCGENLASLGETILRKNLLQAQPDYLDAFDFVMDSSTLYKCNMFITRRNIFNAYCKWLFSFIIDATEEFLRTPDLEKITDKRRRLLGYFSERLMNTWLIKNRLRIKELTLMQV